MTRARTNTPGLTRLLNAVERPVYVLDGDRTLVFCNEACLRWVRQSAEELLGRPCAYHSSTTVTGPEAVLAGLCPPPAVWERHEPVGVIAALDAQGQPHLRRAQFLRLDADRGAPGGLLVLVDPEDLPRDHVPNDPLSDEAAELHQRVREFRASAAASCRVDRLIGESPAMRRARAQVELAAESRASVLIVGPSGSGRQFLADAIHYAPRSEPRGTLIPLACSVLSIDLIHSALLAVAKRSTLGEKATGTLLLNDADQLPPEVQGEVTAILTSRTFPLRILATARQPLADLARRGEYRADLAAALSTLLIELPPLAERREDIPPLAQLFLEELNISSERQLAGFTSEAMDCLDAYPWPGNLDELVQVVSEAYRRAERTEIGVADLPERIHLAAAAAAHPRPVESRIVLDEFLGRIERELIERALRRAKGNKTKAAKLLGMTRPRLYRRLVQLGLAPPEEE